MSSSAAPIATSSSSSGNNTVLDVPAKKDTRGKKRKASAVLVVVGEQEAEAPQAPQAPKRLEEEPEPEPAPSSAAAAPPALASDAAVLLKVKRPTKKSIAEDAAAAAEAARKLLPPPPTTTEILAAKRELARSKWLEMIEVAAVHDDTDDVKDEDDDAAAAAAKRKKKKHERLASSLEKCVFNHAVLAAREKALLIHPGCSLFWNLYVARARTLQRNFQRKPAFLRSVCVGAITPQELQAMTTIEFDLDHWRVQLDAKSKRTASQFETRLVANTSAYTCEHCGSKQCTYYELQLRSSDEPATIFVTCIDCGHRWSD